MKLFKLRLIKRYRVAHRASRAHLRQRPYIIPLMGVLFGVAIVGGILLSKPSALTLRPSESKVVFLTDNGQRETLDTKAATVGDLIKKLPLNLAPQDVVEPSLDTPIVQDDFRINIYRARPVTVVNNGQKTVILTAQRDPRAAALSAGLTVYPEDYVNFAPGDISQNIVGEQIVVDPATPVQLTLYGTPLTVRTHTKTVGDLLKEKKVKIDSKDTIKPDLSTPITANLAVSVVRNGIQTVTVQQPINPPTQYVNDSSLSFGATAVRQAGTPGVEAITYQIDVEGGVEVSRTVLQDTVVTPAVPRVIAVGTIVDISADKESVMAASGIASSDYGYVDYIVSHESGWCYTKAQGEGYCPAYPDNAYTSYGYGLCQATPGYKMSSSGSDWATNPVTQLHWCSGYAYGRYGSWYAAYSHWLAYHNW